MRCMFYCRKCHSVISFLLFCIKLEYSDPNFSKGSSINSHSFSNCYQNHKTCLLSILTVETETLQKLENFLLSQAALKINRSYNIQISFEINVISIKNDVKRNNNNEHQVFTSEHVHMLPHSFLM